MQEPEHERRGFALAAAVLALIVVGALVTGGFYIATYDARTNRAAASAERAYSHADRGLNVGMAVYRKADLERIKAGTTRVDTTYVLEAATPIVEGGDTIGEYTLWARRLGPSLYLLGSEGAVLDGLGAADARRAVGALVRTRSLDVPMDRALQVSGPLTVEGDATIDGTDHPPAGWEDCDSVEAGSGLVSPDTSIVRIAGTARALFGAPPIVQDSTVTAASYEEFGDIDVAGLAADADVTLASRRYTTIRPLEAADAECDTVMETNWGAPNDPAHACHDYFPTVDRAGDLEIDGDGAGQGILRVEGDLVVSGGFEFYGIVLVGGSLRTAGAGAHLNGLVMVAGGSEAQVDASAAHAHGSTIAGGSTVTFSSCAIRRAGRHAGGGTRLVPIRERERIDFSAIGSGVHAP